MIKLVNLTNHRPMSKNTPQIRFKSLDFENSDVWVDNRFSRVSHCIQILSWTCFPLPKSAKKFLTIFRKTSKFSKFHAKMDIFLKKCFKKSPQIRSKSSDFENFDIWVHSPDSEVSPDIKMLSWTCFSDSVNGFQPTLSTQKRIFLCF